MLRILLFLFLSLTTFTHATALEPGDTALNWNLEARDGSSIDYYQDSAGQVSVVVFWATWCPYCAKLMPHIEEVYKQFKDRDVKFYAIDIFEDGKVDPVTYFDNKGYTYTILLLGDLVAEDYGAKGTPSLFVVDKNKKVIYKRASGTNELQVKQDITDKIEQALAK